MWPPIPASCTASSSLENWSRRDRFACAYFSGFADSTPPERHPLAPVGPQAPPTRGTASAHLKGTPRRARVRSGTRAAGLHRRDRRFDQDGAAPWPGASGPTSTLYTERAQKRHRAPRTHFLESGLAQICRIAIVLVQASRPLGARLRPHFHKRSRSRTVPSMANRGCAVPSGRV